MAERLTDVQLDKLAEEVRASIAQHREQVPGRDSSSPHLYRSSPTEEGDDGARAVRFWSDQGFFHDCKFGAAVGPHGELTFTHCGDRGMDRLAEMVREDYQTALQKLREAK